MRASVNRRRSVRLRGVWRGATFALAALAVLTIGPGYRGIRRALATAALVRAARRTDALSAGQDRRKSGAQGH
jgi:hypothetical protein